MSGTLVQTLLKAQGSARSTLLCSGTRGQRPWPTDPIKLRGPVSHPLRPSCPGLRRSWKRGAGAAGEVGGGKRAWGGDQGGGLRPKQTLNRRVAVATAFPGLPWRLVQGRVVEGSPQEPPLASCCVFLFCHRGNNDLSLLPPPPAGGIRGLFPREGRGLVLAPPRGRGWDSPGWGVPARPGPRPRPRPGPARARCPASHPTQFANASSRQQSPLPRLQLPQAGEPFPGV